MLEYQYVKVKICSKVFLKQCKEVKGEKFLKNTMITFVMGINALNQVKVSLHHSPGFWTPGPLI